jgi:phosphoglycerate dehydrogenase-like enzyme
MTDVFRVAISSDFYRPDGSQEFAELDLTQLHQMPGVVVKRLSGADPILSEDVEDCDAMILLATGFAATSVPTSKRLAVIARWGVGYDKVDVEACTEAGIALCITPDGVRRPVAVSIITLMLALTGKLMVKDRLARMGAAGFQARGANMGVGLVGLTLGSIGVGNIGAEMFRLAKPFDMNFLACDPVPNPALDAELGLKRADIDDVFRLSDIITINCPLAPATRHLVNARRLALMKPTAYIINTARGGIIDQKALTLALQEKRIAGAGLDVFEVEPTDPSDPIFALDNVIVSPHALCWTNQLFSGLNHSDIRAVLDVRLGKLPPFIVNGAVEGSPSFKAKLASLKQRFV